MRYAAGVSLTLLRKGRGQDGDLLFLQLLDFIPQLDNSLPNCPDLGRVTERAERDMGYSRPRLLLGSSYPLANPGQDSIPLPSGRTPRPGSPAVPCPGAPPARLAPCPLRPSCHPPARPGVIGTTVSLRLSPRRTHRLPGLSFLAISHPSLPRRPGVLRSSSSARPHPRCLGVSPASARGSCPAWWPELSLLGVRPGGPQTWNTRTPLTL